MKPEVLCGFADLGVFVALSGFADLGVFARNPASPVG